MASNLALGALTVLLTAGAGPALPEQSPSATLALRGAALTLAPDSVSGLSVILLAAPGRREARGDGGAVWLRINPDSAMEWLNGAAAAIRAPVAHAMKEGIQWSRALPPIAGGGGLALGRTRKGDQMQKAHWLAISDAGTGYRIEVDQAQADSVLRLVLVLSSLSRIDTAATAPFEPDRVDRPAAVERQPAPRPLANPGRAAVRYVIGADGSVEAGSFAVVGATDPGLDEEARSLVRGGRYRPALRDGVPVRQVMRQTITWPPR